MDVNVLVTIAADFHRHEISERYVLAPDVTGRNTTLECDDDLGARRAVRRRGRPAVIAATTRRTGEGEDDDGNRTADHDATVMVVDASTGSPSMT